MSWHNKRKFSHSLYFFFSTSTNRAAGAYSCLYTSTQMKPHMGPVHTRPEFLLM